MMADQCTLNIRSQPGRGAGKQGLNRARTAAPFFMLRHSVWLLPIRQKVMTVGKKANKYSQKVKLVL